MKKKRDIFSELTEGFDALKSQRERKCTLLSFKFVCQTGRLTQSPRAV